MRRIHEIDLARVAVLPPEQQPAYLRTLKGFKPTHTLNPFRRVIPDLVNMQYDLLPKAPETVWERIEAKIRKDASGEFEAEKNIGVALALYNFCVEREVVSYSKYSSAWSVGFGNAVSYWHNFYSVWNQAASFVFFDPRTSNPLTEEARRFAFSLMHQRLRVDDPDYQEVELVIARFGRRVDGSRFVRPFRASDVDLYSRDDLTEMIDFTYRLWVEELGRRREERRRGSGGSGNPMGF